MKRLRSKSAHLWKSPAGNHVWKWGSGSIEKNVGLQYLINDKAAANAAALSFYLHGTVWPANLVSVARILATAAGNHCE